MSSRFYKILIYGVYDGIEGLYILLSELKKSKLLFVITHNKALKSMLDSAETLTVIKKNGISSLGRK